MPCNAGVQSISSKGAAPGSKGPSGRSTRNLLEERGMQGSEENREQRRRDRDMSSDEKLME
eukprot:895773-Prymnesium_polylepis.1